LHTGHLTEAVGLARGAHGVDWAPLAVAMSVGPSLEPFRLQLLREGIDSAGLLGASQWSQVIEGLHGHDPYETPHGFADAFFRRYSATASYFSAGAMACGLVYEEAFRQAGTVDAAAVRDALAQTDLSTFFAHIRLSDTSDPPRLNNDKPIYTIQVRWLDEELGEVVVQPDLEWPFGWDGATQ